MRTIELWQVPDCPLIDKVRAALRECLRDTGIDVPVREREGAYPSPTLVIDGIDVATGTRPPSGSYCRLDLPTHEQILRALVSDLPD